MDDLRFEAGAVNALGLFFRVREMEIFDMSEKMTKTRLQCAKCGCPIEKQPGKGRPPRWCSTECRRAAELEIKRINRRIQVLEEQLSELENRPVLHDYTWVCGCRGDREHMRHLRKQIETAEKRLKALFEEQDQ